MKRVIVACAAFLVALSLPVPVAAQHEHMAQPNADAAGWQFMQDGIVFGMFNHQGGPRGGDEFKVPNWWMGMGTRTFGSSRLTLTGMFSLDPATVGKRGYGEIFQVGEAVDGEPLVDRQHPHDLFMQLAAAWRVPVSDTTGFTLSGGPVAEPALGPVPFMHRASATDNPLAPLSHHTFDSTHIAFGVVTAAVDHGPWTVEGSVFNGREPDDERWDFDFGRLDSVSVRAWFRPSERWTFQASTGHLTEPEELEPGNAQRTTVSASWTSTADADFTAVTVGYGVNAAHESARHAWFGEVARRRGGSTFFSRAETRQSETQLIFGDQVLNDDSAVGAFTVGAVQDVLAARGVRGGLGAAVTFYAVPDIFAGTHGRHPVSYQVFFRLRPSAQPGHLHAGMHRATTPGPAVPHGPGR